MIVWILFLTFVKGYSAPNSTKIAIMLNCQEFHINTKISEIEENRRVVKSLRFDNKPVHAISASLLYLNMASPDVALSK